eukprot:4358594-Prymnesium_polylepis.2
MAYSEVRQHIEAACAQDRLLALRLEEGKHADRAREEGAQLGLARALSGRGGVERLELLAQLLQLLPCPDRIVPLCRLGLVREDVDERPVVAALDLQPLTLLTARHGRAKHRAPAHHRCEVLVARDGPWYRHERTPVDAHLARLQRDAQLILALLIDPTDGRILEALPLVTTVGLQRLECAVAIVVARLERHATREQHRLLLAVALLALALVNVFWLAVGAMDGAEQLARPLLAHRRLGGEVEAPQANGGVATKVHEDMVVQDDEGTHAVHPRPAYAP